jgi:hypothetical protein
VQAVINSIYYLPGHGGRLTTGLGEALSQRGLAIDGRETVGEFLSLPFLEQVALVGADLQANFWSPNALVIANSFGAYLFFHAQASISPYPGRVLILSPIIGDFQNESIGAFFSPPYPKKLEELADARVFPSPLNAQIHVGSEDWQSNPEQVQRFGELTKIPVTIVYGAGHMLPKSYVANLLDEWL